MIIEVAVVVVAATKERYRGSVDLVGECGVAGVLKDHNDTIGARWQNVLDEISPKQSSSHGTNY